MYSKNMIERATALLGERRRRAQETALARQKEVYAAQPKLLALGEDIRLAAMSLATAAMSEDGPALVEATAGRIRGIQEEKRRLLAEMGLTPEDLEPDYTCKKCRDTGIAEGGRCGCFDEAVRAECCRSLPEACFRGLYDFSAFDLSFYPEVPDKSGVVPRRAMTGILEKCQRYACFFGPGSPSLLFQGKTGLGKTHLSLAIAAYVAQQGASVLYAPVQSLVDRYERIRFGKSPTPQDEEFVATVPLCDLLVLDDLGAEFSNSFSQSVLYNILNDRIMAGRPMILSTNLGPEQLVAAYGDRIASRILCECEAYTFWGSDIRLEKRKREFSAQGHR